MRKSGQSFKNSRRESGMYDLPGCQKVDAVRFYMFKRVSCAGVYFLWKIFTKLVVPAASTCRQLWPAVNWGALLPL